MLDNRLENGSEDPEDVLILAIESSCDETAAAVVKNGRGGSDIWTPGNIS